MKNGAQQAYEGLSCVTIENNSMCVSAFAFSFFFFLLIFFIFFGFGFGFFFSCHTVLSSLRWFNVGIRFRFRFWFQWRKTTGGEHSSTINENRQK